jgi:Malectin domain/IPT/TIG domain
VDTLYVTGGSTYSATVDILDTEDNQLYQSYRDGAFSYALPSIPDGNYELSFYFAEIYYNTPGARIFSIVVEDSVHFTNVDVVALSDGRPKVALVLETVASVTDSVLNIEFLDSGRGRPFVSGIEIELLKPHLAHAVAQGPYFAVDVNHTGMAVVAVDGSFSHTHGVGLSLTSFLWKVGSTTIGRGQMANLVLPVGEHIVTLLVTDSGGNESFESTNVTVFPFSYPAIQYVDTNTSSTSGGMFITIFGSGFTTPSNSSSIVKVYFGDIFVQGTGNVQILDQYRIRVKVPPYPIAVPVDWNHRCSSGFVGGNFRGKVERCPFYLRIWCTNIISEHKT